MEAAFQACGKISQNFYRDNLYLYHPVIHFFFEQNLDRFPVPIGQLGGITGFLELLEFSLFLDPLFQFPIFLAPLLAKFAPNVDLLYKIVQIYFIIPTALYRPTANPWAILRMGACGL